MNVWVLDALAQAIYAYEGNRPTDRAYRNNNPGNLRARAPDQPKDADGYRVFPTYMEGYRELLIDLRAKVTGQNTHGLNADSTLLDFFKVYAPARDHNAPSAYAAFVANWLGATYGGVSMSTAITIRGVYARAGEEVPGGVTAT